MSKDVTMRDIAKKLNMSAVSVSKAISGKEGVSAPVRELVLKTAAEMGYVYTSPALSKAGTRKIGVLVSHAFISDSAFYSQMYNMLSMMFARDGHVCTLEILNQMEEKEGVLPKKAENGYYEGLVVLGPMSDAVMSKLLYMETPCVYMDNYTVKDSADCVVSDSVFGSHMLTNYLIEKGFKKIAFVGSIKATNSIMDRYLGYLKGMMTNGLEIRSEYVIADRDSDGMLCDIEIPWDMPEAFVCNCDETAYHLLEQLRRMKVKVPEDVSVVGFDDYVFATISNPKLTTFRVDMEKMCEAALGLMNEKFVNTNIFHPRIVVGGEIVIRDSVKE